MHRARSRNFNGTPHFRLSISLGHKHMQVRLLLPQQLLSFAVVNRNLVKLDWVA